MNFSLNSLFEQLALSTCIKGQQTTRRNKKNASSSAEVERRRVYPNTAMSGTDNSFMQTHERAEIKNHRPPADVEREGAFRDAGPTCLLTWGLQKTRNVTNSMKLPGLKWPGCHPSRCFHQGLHLGSHKRTGLFLGLDLLSSFKGEKVSHAGKVIWALGPWGTGGISLPLGRTALPKLCLHLQRMASWPRSMTEEEGWERKKLYSWRNRNTCGESYKRQTLHGEQHKGKDPKPTGATKSPGFEISRAHSNNKPHR